MSRFCIVIAFCLLIHATCSGATVTLTTGETLAGQIISHNDQAMTLQHSFLGTLTIPADKIAEVNHATPQMQPDSTDHGGDPAIHRAQLTDMRFVDGWKAQLELGGAETSGNTETLNLRAAFNAKKETELDRWKLDSAYIFSSNQHETTKNAFTAGILKDWLIPDQPWFYYAEGRYDFNQFQDWRHRIDGAAGMGYQLLKTDTLSILTRTGLGGAKEFGDSNELRPEAQLGGELAWKISRLQSLSATTYYYPDLLDFHQYRTRSTLDWTIKLSNFEGLSLKLGLENAYQSFTSDDSFHNDFKAFGSLMVDF